MFISTLNFFQVEMDDREHSKRWKQHFHNCAPEVIESPPRFSVASDVWEDGFIRAMCIILPSNFS